MPIIDAHALLGPWPQSARELTLDDLTAAMQSRAVGKALVTHTSAIFYETGPGNDLARAVARQNPAIIPVGVINPLRYPACLDEIQRCLTEGVRTFRLCPREHRYPFHGSVGPLREVLANMTGARLVLVDLAGLPNPVVSPDMAELLPCATAFTVENDSLGTILHLAQLAPNAWAETSRLDGGGVIQAAVKHMGADRLIFGSGAPLLSLGSAVMSIQYAEVADNERLQIFEGNVTRALS